MRIDRLALFIILPIAAYAGSKPDGIRVEQKFQSGGRIEMRLESGGYVISGTDSENIAVTYSCDSPERLRAVKVKMNIDGDRARIAVENTPNNNFSATIEVPKRSALWVRLTAGDLEVEGAEGDKDVEARAGNIEVRVAHPEEYGERDASVTAGDLDASAFNIEKSGLWRSFRQTGPGRYRLHAHLMAGNISLTQGN